MAAEAGTAAAPAKAGDRIYETIKSELYIELAPGDRLTEQSVSRRFGVSRIPVREALHRLVQEGYLRAHRRAGYTVREIGQRAYRELMDVRLLLETQALRLFQAQGAGAADDALERLAAEWQSPEAEPSSADLNARNRHFHETLVALAGNRELTGIHSGVMERIEVIQRLDFTQTQRVQDTYREHHVIIRALLERRHDDALRALEQHIRNSARTVSALAGEAIS